MAQLKHIFLPGLDKQFLQLVGEVNTIDKKILIIGAGTEEIAKAFVEMNNEVIVVVEDQENLLQLKYITGSTNNISIRLMGFDNTDFKNEKFDIVYAQASVSEKKRSKIVKEIWRILKPAGIFCVGEISNLKRDIPQFIKDIWEQSGLSPLFSDDLNSFYTERGYLVKHEYDLSYTLKDFYLLGAAKLKQSSEKLSDNEKSYYKKLLKQISHESNVYLRLGGEAHIGFKMLILEKALY